MTKPLITLPCTAQELENALHASCDHDGLWDGRIKVYLVNGDNGTETRICLETEEKDHQSFCGCCANKECEAKGATRVVVCDNFK